MEGPELWLARHGETEWSRSGRHTGVTDLPLTADGERKAAQLAARLDGVEFAQVLVSPLRRARQTARLAGFGDRAQVDADAHEWRYGDYEGLTTAQIRERAPGWTIWTGGCPNGETAAQVGARADRLVSRARAHGGRTLLFAHGHLLRVVAARWLDLAPEQGADFILDVATVSVLAAEHGLPAVRRWNS